MQNGLTREQVSNALFKCLQAAFNFNMASREPAPPSQGPGAAQPALYLANPNDEETQMNQTRAGGLTQYKMKFVAIVYCQRPASSTDPQGAPAISLLNEIADAFDAALTPVPPNGLAYQNLALFNNGVGACQHAWCEGVVHKDDGTVAQPQMAMVYPITVLCGP